MATTFSTLLQRLHALRGQLAATLAEKGVEADAAENLAALSAKLP